MKLRDDAVIKDSYQVVVVGSGLAGLTAAALLAKKGLDVLLLEHHYLPGGMCTTFRRQDISFDTGTALLFGFGEKGVNPHRFVMNELEEHTDIIQHKALLQIRFGDKIINFWPDLDRFLEELTAAFPAQETELQALYDYLYKIYTEIIARQQMIVPPTEIPQKDNMRVALKNPGALIQTLKMLTTPTEKILKKFITDSDLLAFFDKLTGAYCYCDISETPAILAATMFIDNHIGGAYYPARSPQVLSSTLEKALEKYGGQTLYRVTVEEIFIEKGSAKGVRLADGTIIGAEKIVANCTVWNLYGKLIKPRHIKPKKLKWAANLVPTYPSVVLYLGVDAEAIPEDTNPVVMVIEDKKGVNQGDVTCYISSIDDPSICPEGMHAMTVIGPSFDTWPDPFDEGYRKSKPYLEHKESEKERILDQLEKHFPGLRKHIRVMEAATPATIERYTLKNGGAVGGPKQAIGQEIMKRLHAKSEWKNLYFCGDSTTMGMGTPAVTVSGVGAANMVLRDLGMSEYQPHEKDGGYVHLVKGKFLEPLPDPSQPIDSKSAKRLARQCSYCEEPGCRKACPAGIDMSNVIRRIEAGNIIGAARTLRETNPLAEVCGHTCKPKPACEQNCNRLEFDKVPVRIADLQTWVCAEAGEQGWPVQKVEKSGIRVAVVGAGPAGLTGANFMARLGYDVHLFDKNEQPGGSLLVVKNKFVPKDAVQRDIAGIMKQGITFHSSELGKNLDPEALISDYKAVLLATGLNPIPGLDKAVKDTDNVFSAGSMVLGSCGVVNAVGDARKAAGAIDKYLKGND
ncbi:NAD(P)-binding protein [candidate division WOR-3 bacterium]|uniref:NAD(P)-binding protein n=1 Tax=candidate division WOR-3 bacterium TaxID=2052148 RepID=A0A9D5KAU0_UNCW3|nr:NAD(P)-binding protein [candidate division WOR-3 bacterium]